MKSSLIASIITIVILDIYYVLFTSNSLRDVLIVSIYFIIPVVLICGSITGLINDFLINRVIKNILVQYICSLLIYMLGGIGFGLLTIKLIVGDIRYNLEVLGFTTIIATALLHIRYLIKFLQRIRNQ
jgi:hypothetical protein